MLEIKQKVGKEVLELLNKNVIGTPSIGMLYRHTNIQRKIAHIPKAFYTSIKRREKALAAICFVHRIIDGVESYYIRFFTFDQIFRRKVSSRIISSNKKRNTLKDEFTQLLSGKLFNTPDNIIYSYIEPGNIRSLNMAKRFGFEIIRSFETLLFSRIFPKKSSDVRRIKQDEIPLIKKKLKELYREYLFFNFENIFMEDNYYVLEKGGKLVAGLQAHPDMWKVLELPGISGKIMLNLISALPLINRIFSRNYKFLTIEGAYFKNSIDLNELLEGVLHITGRNTAMIPVDTKSQLYEVVSTIDFGLLNKLHKPKPIHVVTKFNGVIVEQQKKYTEQPAYISGYDIS